MDFINRRGQLKREICAVYPQLPQKRTNRRKVDNDIIKILWKFANPKI